jgi:RHS repeat-associated protein
LLPTSYADVPNTTNANFSFTNTFDNLDVNFRNSFYWGPLQHIRLSTNYLQTGVLTDLTLTDYKLARLRHWLKSRTDDYSDHAFLGATISLERVPSPDGITEGQKTWYDHANKPLENVQPGPAMQNSWVPLHSGGRPGDQLRPLFVAQVLPDGTNRFERTEYNEWGSPINVISTYTLNDGTVGVRTNTYIYANNGIDMLLHVGPDGSQVSSNRFNPNHQVTTNFNALNEQTVNTYDASGQLTSVKTPAGLTTTNIYNSDGRVEKTIDLEINRTNLFTYYTNGLLRVQTDERGLATTNTWDNLQRLVSVSYPDDTTMSNRYTHLDLTATKDRLGHWTHFVYNGIRQRTAVTNALTNVTLYTYCTCGALESIRDPLNNYTYFYYDTAGRTTNVIHPGGRSVNYRYNLVGQLLSETDNAGVSLTNWYNHHGLLVTVSNAFGRVQSMIYDIEDRATNTVDANGVTITTTYDALGRVLTRTYPDSGTERFGYSARGLIASTNQLTNVTFYAYDEAGRKTAETNANIEITQFKYDPSGNLTNIIDGKSQSTFWKYDLHGRMTNKVDHTGADMFRYAYDANGRLTNRWTPAKLLTKYGYDAVGNLTSIDYSNSTDIALSYDANNRLTNMVDATGTTRYSYSGFGAIASEDGPWENDTVSYTYANELRNGLTLQQPSSSAWAQTYDYDTANRLTAIASPAGTFAYGYHAGFSGPSPATLVRQISLPNSSAITNRYDTHGHLLGTWLRDNAGTILNKHEDTLNDLDHRTNTVRVDGSYVDYTYDPLGQLKTALGKESGGTTNRWHEQFRYTYDAAGNLTERVQNTLTNSFSLNYLNQLTGGSRGGKFTAAGTTTSQATNVTVNTSNAVLFLDYTFASTNHALIDGTNTFTAIGRDNVGRSDTNIATAYLPSSPIYVYDANGNLTCDGHKALEYDDENQLIRLTSTNAWKSEFVYDGQFRRRIRREHTWQNSAWVQTNEVRYVYDGNLEIQWRDNFNLPTLTLTRGIDLSGSLQGAGGIGGFLAFSRDSTLDPQHAYYHADGNGNVTTLLDANQKVVGRYAYEPFGRVFSISGPLAEANPYRFNSKEAHPVSGLNYYLYRCYDPSLHRWVNRDPIEEQGGINLYAFVANNPLSFVDPDGQAGVAVAIEAAKWAAVAGAIYCYLNPKCREAAARLAKDAVDAFCNPKNQPKNPCFWSGKRGPLGCHYVCWFPGGGTYEKWFPPDPVTGCKQRVAH